MIHTQATIVLLNNHILGALMEMNAATLETYTEHVVGWTANHGPRKFHINTPSGHPSTLLS